MGSFGCACLRERREGEIITLTGYSLQTPVMSFSSEEIISSLKGQVIKKNENKTEYGEATEWTPYNAELNMQSIKVMVRNPMPEKVSKDSSFEDTMMLLEERWRAGTNTKSR